MAKKKKTGDPDTVAVNRRARHDYDVSQTVEAGLALTGTEVKSLRAGKASLVGAFAAIKDDEAWLVQAHIPEYVHGNRENHDPTRQRKLLLHRSEIERARSFTRERGRTLVPLKLYWKDGNAKVSIGFATGKSKRDRRAELARKDAQRAVERTMKQRTR